jgi:hypothetical protein
MATADQLEHRLRTGERMIEAEPDPKKRERLESHWVALLKEYERMVDAERERRERGVAA